MINTANIDKDKKIIYAQRITDSQWGRDYGVVGGYYMLIRNNTLDAWRLSHNGYTPDLSYFNEVGRDEY